MGKGAIGYVSKLNNSSAVEFRVSTLKDLVDVILPHFCEVKLPFNCQKTFRLSII